MYVRADLADVAVLSVGSLALLAEVCMSQHLARCTGHVWPPRQSSSLYIYFFLCMQPEVGLAARSAARGEFRPRGQASGLSPLHQNEPLWAMCANSLFTFEHAV